MGHATRIEIHGTDDVRVYAPFEAKDTIKARPVRHWDKTLRAWIVPLSDVETVRILLTRCGYPPLVIDHRPIKHTTNGAQAWADALFAQVPERLHGRLFRAMVGSSIRTRAAPGLGTECGHDRALLARDREDFTSHDRRRPRPDLWLAGSTASSPTGAIDAAPPASACSRLDG